MAYILDAACLCNTGRVRKNNEDNFYFDGRCLDVENNGLRTPLVMKKPLRQGLCVAVFDGMGGENFGEYASFAAAECMQSLIRRQKDGYTPDRKSLNQICVTINDAVVAKQRELCTERMGSTLVGLYFARGMVYSFNLGDSRAYRLRDGEFLQISEDHVEKREGKSSRKAPLTQHLGINPEDFLIEPSIAKDELRPGDQFLLCSDGLTDMLTNLEIDAIMTDAPSCEECARRLVEAALEHGGRDNVTVIVGRISDDGTPEEPVRSERGETVGVMAAATREAEAPGAAQASAPVWKRIPKRAWLGAAIGAAGLALLLLIGFFTIHKWTPATCTEPETCTICGKTRGEALGHDWSEPTCTEPGICKVCGAEGAPALGHDYKAATCTEPEICIVCGADGAPALGHDWTPATFLEAAVCRRCGEIDPSGPKQYDSSPYTADRVREEAQRAADDPTIEYSMTSPDGTQLEVPKDEEFLDFPRKMVLNAGSSAFFDFLPTPGTGHGALGHGSTGEIVLIVATRVSKEELDENANPVSTGEPGENGDPVIYYFTVATDGRAGWNRRTSFFCCEHVGCNGYHEWHQATCVMPESCSKCGATRGDLGEHDYSKATCQKPETCKYCGATKGGPDPNAHVWQFVGCEEQEVCAHCGAKGSVSHHQFVRTECEKPMQCSVCGAEGPVAEHDWKVTETKKATCTENGEVTYSCSFCLAKKTETEDANGHNWEWKDGNQGPGYWECSICHDKRFTFARPDPFSRVSIIVREQ